MERTGVPQKPNSRSIKKQHFPKKKPFNRSGPPSRQPQTPSPSSSPRPPSPNSLDAVFNSLDSNPSPSSTKKKPTNSQLKFNNSNKSKSRQSIRMSREQAAEAAHKKTMKEGPRINDDLVRMLGRRRCNNIRVVWIDEETGKSKAKVCTLKEAYTFSKSLSLDLTLISPIEKLDPQKEVICKILDWKEMEKDRKKKEREEKRAKEKKGGGTKSVKEYKFSGSIYPNDRDRLINRAIQSLSKGHPVKTTLNAKRRELALNPSCVYEVNEVINRALDRYAVVNGGFRKIKEGSGSHVSVWHPRSNILGILKKVEEEEGRLFTTPEMEEKA